MSVVNLQTCYFLISHGFILVVQLSMGFQSEVAT